ncbi:hypothetical protein [Couchioplanes caeruleus]|nr:hypothetical protein [Couchioplanes caeruleus]
MEEPFAGVGVLVPFPAFAVGSVDQEAVPVVPASVGVVTVREVPA